MVPLLSNRPAAIQKKETNTGNTPLHVALAINAPQTRLESMVRLWPDAARVKNKEGNTPLHIALLNKVPEVVIESVLGAWPNATAVLSKDGNAPLNIAFRWHALSDALLTSIIAATPDGMRCDAYLEEHQERLDVGLFLAWFEGQ